MKNKFTILGCGSSLGSPWITNYKGKLKNNSKNIRTRCCAHIQYRDMSVLIDTSPDIKNQFLKNKINSLDAIIYTIADYIRNVRSEGERAPLSFRKNDELDDNKLIMSIVDDWECVESPQHKMMLWNLFKMLDCDIFRD